MILLDIQYFAADHLFALQAAFFAILCILCYTYLGYPLLLYGVGLIFRKKRNIDKSYLPAVSVIIPAYNEATCIEKKIKNTLELDYPEEKLEVIVASDASTDDTVKIAKTHEPRIRLFDFKERTGKMGIINKVVREARGDILILTDANSIFAGYTIKEFVKYFTDKRIGCVSGAKIIRNLEQDTSTDMGESRYWKYESFLKYLETLSGSCVGADGSVYAVRKDLYPFPPDNKIIMDDFAVSLLVIKKGHDCVFEPAARAFEESTKRVRQEFPRKCRIFAGAFSFIMSRPGVLFSSIFFKLFSHKILRWMTFLFQVLLFMVSFLLYVDPLFRPVFGIQVIFYACAFTGLVLNRLSIRISLFHIPYYFTMTTFAQVYGLVYFLRHGNKPAWEKLR
jgi:cellulose synthase/poly-beta-1,6-N-acetylglucosamine synthase-like glycosyltransferase